MGCCTSDQSLGAQFATDRPTKAPARIKGTPSVPAIIVTPPTPPLATSSLVDDYHPMFTTISYLTPSYEPPPPKRPTPPSSPKRTSSSSPPSPRASHTHSTPPASPRTKKPQALVDNAISTTATTTTPTIINTTATPSVPMIIITPAEITPSASSPPIPSATIVITPPHPPTADGGVTLHVFATPVPPAERLAQVDLSAKQRLEIATQNVMRLKKEGAPLARIQAATEEYKATRAAYEAEAAKLAVPASPRPEKVVEQPSSQGMTAKEKMDRASATVAKLKREHASLEDIRAAVDVYKSARAEHEAAASHPSGQLRVP